MSYDETQTKTVSYNTDTYKSLLEHVNCNLCGTDNYDVIYQPTYELSNPDNIRETFRSSGDEILIDQLVRCRRCGLQYLNPRLKSNLIIDGYSAGTDETFVSQVEARERTFEKQIQFIERIVPNKGRILDVGTAGGAFPGIAKKHGWNVDACEPNRWLVQWGNNRYGINIQAGTIFDMNLTDTSFDVVTLWDVLEHTVDPSAILRECRRVLKPNGVLIVNYPAIDSFIAKSMGRKWVFLLSIHLYYFTAETIRKMLESVGFEFVMDNKYWQTLELGYIFYRMGPYSKLLSKIGMKVSKTLYMDKNQIPYWMGQVMAVARRK